MFVVTLQRQHPTWNYNDITHCLLLLEFGFVCGGSQLNVQLIADNPGGPAAVNWKNIANNHCIEIMESVQGIDI